MKDDSLFAESDVNAGALTLDLKDKMARPLAPVSNPTASSSRAVTARSRGF